MKNIVRGASLVGVLIGLTLSLVVLLALAGLNRGVVRSVFGTAPGSGTGMVANARLDGQMASALLTAQLALQEAGFGIKDAKAGTELVLLTNASLGGNDGRKLSGTLVTPTSAGVAANAVVWVSNPQLSSNAANHRCQALLWTSNDNAVGTLRLLTAAGACNPLSTSWSTVAWDSSTLVAPEVGASGLSLLAKSDANCWPFGALPKTMSSVDPPGATLELTISYRFSTLGTGSTAAAQTQKICLANFQA